MNVILRYYLLFLLVLTGCSKQEYANETYEGVVDTIAKQDVQIQAYISSHNLTMQKDPTGMYYKIYLAGDSLRMTENSVPTIIYTRSNLQDSLLDASFGSTNFDGRKLKDHIVGWQIGLQQIGKGGKILMIIPSPLAFGKEAVGNIIPANTILVCEVELVDFQ
ncbi:FKBP-type peptidyl-prolyl cis-trans isomerase [Chitinophaga sp. CF118]|uniref:FKBP-type peptidyl-prolyl cis-trans isomerase n=1 Tax=Chitinophaga sp. CF118 TaxID=1884367 RepID=UPI0015A5CB66|nr:FKBP-type peptidyl-prolyl cis-trans isomerase [Chitinophaga sp. CF118]